MEKLREKVEHLDRIILSMQRKIRRNLLNELTLGKISIPQFHILSYLLEKKKAIMVELAKFMGVSASAITNLVDGLANMELIKREYSPYDRRIIIASLTEKGKKVILKIKHQFEELLGKILKEFTPEEREKLLELSEKMEKLL
ncbi:MarR family transcriptional regulator [Candidatus Calescamantes bacterium]|nr:MarR family transcriptional regulator [Candidatus Calescamantes bacterium]